METGTWAEVRWGRCIVLGVIGAVVVVAAYALITDADFAISTVKNLL